MVKICIFGDSITWGARLPFRAGWANLLRNYLELTSEEYIELYDLGIDGNTTIDILNRFDIEVEARNPQIIIFAIGTNDSCYRKTKNNSIINIDEFKNNLDELIQRAKKYTDNIVFVGIGKGSDVLTKPLIASSTGKCYDKENIKTYDKIIKKICKKNNLLFIDINEKLLDSDFDDGLHPNIGGHIKIFEEFRRNLPQMLKLKTIYEDVKLVNDLDEEIGYKKYGTLNKEDIYRVSAVWVKNNKNEILISRRLLSKKKEPGKWGPSVAKRVFNKEEYLIAAKKVLKDILYIKGNELAELCKIRTKTELNNFHSTWYVLKLNKRDIKFNKDEIQEVRWISKQDLIKEYTNNSNKFVDSFSQYIDLL